MFTTMFMELLGLLGSIIVSGLILASLGIFCFFSFFIVKGFKVAYRASKEKNDEVPKM